MNFFQTVILIVFAFFGILAVILFSLTSTGGGNINFAGTFTMWGVLPADTVNRQLEEFNSTYSNNFKVEYSEKAADTFESDLVSALASGTGPDLVILPESLIVQNMDKVLPISFDSYPVRNFSDNFTDGAALFMAKDGIVAMPLYVDPLVMYWNKDIFSTGGVATYPKDWSEFEILAGRLTIADRAGNISQSAVALGAYPNINFAKDIISALFMQADNEIIRFSRQDEMDRTGSQYAVLLGDNANVAALGSALRFYLDFSNPAKKAYSWNVAMPNSRDAFAAGTLAVYFGHASDYKLIQKSNPHLSFDVAVLPQRAGDKTKVTFGNFFGVAVTRGTKNPNVAKTIAIDLSDAPFVRALSDAVLLPPARRDLLSEGTKDSAGSVFYSSAIISKSWFDPMPSETDQIFKEMTESVLSGVKKEVEALADAGQKLNNLLKGK